MNNLASNSALTQRPRTPNGARTAALGAVVALLALAGVTCGQSSMGFGAGDAIVPGMAPPPDANGDMPDEVVQERLRAYRSAGKAFEKELRQIRATYFRTSDVQVRQAGIDRLRAFKEPAALERMLVIFGNDGGDDVRSAILAHLAELGTDEALAALAWTAVFHEERSLHAPALDALARATESKSEVPWSVRSVVSLGLERGQPEHRHASAAKAAETLRLFEAIPMLVNAQINMQVQPTGGGGGGGGGRQGDLANIFIGQQVAYVSDLEPVVGESAVAFDPELSVATDGVVLRILDAVVVSYNADVHRALVGLSKAGGWEESTRRLGWDDKGWKEWARGEFRRDLPAVLQAEAQRRAPTTGGTSGAVPSTTGDADAPSPVSFIPDLDVAVPLPSATPRRP